MKSIISLGLISLLAVSCSSSSDKKTTSLSYTAGGAALKLVTDSLSSSEGVISASIAPANYTPPELQTMASGLNAKWEVANSYNNPKYEPSCSSARTMVTLKEYMGTQFDADQVRCNGSSINIFGRMEGAGGMLCIVMNSLNASTSAELVSAGSATITLDSATKTDLSAKCPSMAASLSNESEVPTGTVVTMTFAAPSVTTTYDLKITVAPFNNVMFIKYGGNEINFANNEDNDNGNQRVLASYNKSTGVLRAEYVSKGSGSGYPLYVHRLFKDETNSKMRVASSIQSNFSAVTATVAPNIEKYIVSGYPGVTTVGLSMEFKAMGTLADGSHDACVNSETGVITNDNPTVTSNAYDCGVTASANKATAAFTGLSSILTSTSVTTPSTWWVLTSGSEALSWTTIDNMLTSGL